MRLYDMTDRRTGAMALVLLEVVAALCMCVGLVLGVVGMHNMDNAQNIRWLNAEYGISLTDMGTNGERYEDSILYLLGMEQVLAAFGILLLSSMVFGGCVVYGSRH